MIYRIKKAWRNWRARRLLAREHYCLVHLTPKRRWTDNVGGSSGYQCEACGYALDVERAERIVRARRTLGGR